MFFRFHFNTRSTSICLLPTLWIFWCKTERLGFIVTILFLLFLSPLPSSCWCVSIKNLWSWLQAVFWVFLESFCLLWPTYSHNHTFIQRLVPLTYLIHLMYNCTHCSSFFRVVVYLFLHWLVVWNVCSFLSIPLSTDRPTFLFNKHCIVEVIFFAMFSIHSEFRCCPCFVYKFLLLTTSIISTFCKSFQPLP
jgi:hypothetical protein